MAKDYTDLEWLTNNVTESTKQAYDKGYDKGYKDAKELTDAEYLSGLDKAWECARKILYSIAFGGYTCGELEKIFDIENMDDTVEIFKKFSASEAIDRIKKYEEEKKANNNFAIGDEIKRIDGSSDKYIFTKPVGAHYANVIAPDGSVAYIDPTKYRKTGRHFPQIAELLGQLKETSNDKK